MSFYSYKNSHSTHCPCSICPNDALNGLTEKVCIQVQRVYDSCLQGEEVFRKLAGPVFRCDIHLALASAAWWLRRL